jgi:glycosyltransferase involved in cell wall biosynthesis
MRVALVNTIDVKGGAARAAYRLHKGLCCIGVDSTYYVRDRTLPDPSIRNFVPDPSPLAVQQRLKRKAAREAAYNAYASTRSPDIELFSQEKVDGDENFFIQLPRADVINLHWVAGFVDYGLFFTPQITRPVVWTLHDMNPFTGGCHYDQGCAKFKTACGACPLLGSQDPRDLSHQVFAAKAEALRDWPQHMLHVVTPSRWLAEEARSSALFGKYTSTVIPNSLETDIFRPMDKAAARAALKLPQDAQIVLFVSNHLRLARKGFRELVHALSLVPDLDKLWLVGVGDSHILSVDAPFKVMQIEHVSDDTKTAMIYAAADVMAIPSRQDNLPNTILESLSCGTPVVGFDVGGVSDLVREDDTGFLAPAGSVPGLSLAFMKAFADRERLLACGARGRAMIVRGYTMAAQAHAYAAFYEKVRAEALRHGVR